MHIFLIIFLILTNFQIVILQYYKLDISAKLRTFSRKAIRKHLNTNDNSQQEDGNTTNEIKYEQYMIKGKDAEIDQFPYQVSLMEADTLKHFCGAVIITSQHVVTAAHCVCRGIHYIQASLIRIKAGDIHIESKPANWYKVKQIYCHPNFRHLTLEHDIAILRAKRPFQFSKHINKIELWPGNNKFRFIKGNLPVIMAGWGSKSFNGEISNHLQYIDSTTLNNKTCFRALGKKLQSNLKEWNICTYNPDKERTCTGDSGGAVVYRNSLLAIVSWSKKCDDHTPGVHTSIPYHYPWIYKICDKTV